MKRRLIPSSPLRRFLENQGSPFGFSTAFSPSQAVCEAEVRQLQQASTNEVEEFKAAVRAGAFSGPTSGVCGGALQANVMILPSEYAFDFTRFCLKNFRSCPLLYVGERGDPGLGFFGGKLGDIRTDLPKYLLWENGEPKESALTDIKSLWRDDLVTFLLGCSFSFETALMREKLSPRNALLGLNVSMYLTNIETEPCGPFRGPLVVSMRPYKADQLEKVRLITEKFPAAHGGPIHWGDPAELGISNILRPDFGDPLPCLEEDDIPVFWCCGVTPQSVVRSAVPKVNFAITHFPGHMFVCNPVYSGKFGSASKLF